MRNHVRVDLADFIAHPDYGETHEVPAFKTEANAAGDHTAIRTRRGTITILGELRSGMNDDAVALDPGGHTWAGQLVFKMSSSVGKRPITSGMAIGGDYDERNILRGMRYWVRVTATSATSGALWIYVE